ncbi:MAG TPA: CBS domain-containing protein [Bradyrhizobium sp.]|nr:CBS domain-containing protein [Bradyrhizobium sp.]
MHEFLEETVGHTMTSPARTVAPEMTVGDILRLFATDRVDAYPVVAGGRLVGIVSEADALKVFAASDGDAARRYDEAMGTTVDEIMSRNVTTVGAKTKLSRVLQLMGADHFKSLPVVDGEDHLEGMIAREDIVRALTRHSPQALPLVPPSVGYYAIA